MGGYGCHAMSIFELTGFGPRGGLEWRGRIMPYAARALRLERDDLPCLDVEASSVYWACVEAATRANADSVYRMIPLATGGMR